MTGRMERSELVGSSCVAIVFSGGCSNKLLGTLLLSLSFWHQNSMLDPE